MRSTNEMIYFRLLGLGSILWGGLGNEMLNGKKHFIKEDLTVQKILHIFWVIFDLKNIEWRFCSFMNNL